MEIENKNRCPGGSGTLEPVKTSSSNAKVKHRF
jgi:hypothetical protein